MIKIVKKLDLAKKKLCKVELGVSPPFHAFINTHMCVCTHMHTCTTHKITHITQTNMNLYTSKYIRKVIGLIHTDVEGHNYQGKISGLRSTSCVRPSCDDENHSPKLCFCCYFWCEIVYSAPNQRRLATALLDSINALHQRERIFALLLPKNSLDQINMPSLADPFNP